MRYLLEFKKDTKSKDGLRSWCIYCCAHYDKERYRANVSEYRNRRLINRYGIDSLQYQEMYSSRLGKCDICGETHDTLGVDHCHSTGRIRGLLCSPCNTAIGLLRDNTVLLKSAINYLLN